MAQGRWVKFFLTIMTFVFFFGSQVTLYAQPYPLEPFVSISVPTTIDLGSIGQFGQQTFNSVIKAHITANCPHHIEASIRETLKNRRNSVVTRKYLKDVINQ